MGKPAQVQATMGQPERLLYLHEFAVLPIGHWLPDGRPTRLGLSLHADRGFPRYLASRFLFLLRWAGP